MPSHQLSCWLQLPRKFFSWSSSQIPLSIYLLLEEPPVIRSHLPCICVFIVIEPLFISSSIAYVDQAPNITRKMFPRLWIIYMALLWTLAISQHPLWCADTRPWVAIPVKGEGVDGGGKLITLDLWKEVLDHKVHQFDWEERRIRGTKLGRHSLKGFNFWVMRTSTGTSDWIKIKIHPAASEHKPIAGRDYK